jgi:hypothetical protein
MAPISKNVIALLTAMLEYMQANPDDTEETEVLIKATLQAISVAKRSSIRRLGDSFLDFADERPAVAFACLLFVVSLNPVGLVTTIAEQYGWIQPRKVQIEVKEPQTGSYRPAAVSELHQLASRQQPTQGGSNVGIRIFGQPIANVGDQRRDSALAPAVEIITPGGTVVSFSGGTNRASGSSGVYGTTGDSGRSWPGGGRSGSSNEMGTPESTRMPFPWIGYRAVH